MIGMPGYWFDATKELKDNDVVRNNIIHLKAKVVFWRLDDDPHCTVLCRADSRASLFRESPELLRVSPIPIVQRNGLWPLDTTSSALR